MLMVVVLDGAGWHRSKKLEVPENLVLVGLPCTHPNSILLNTCGLWCAKRPTIKPLPTFLRSRPPWSIAVLNSRPNAGSFQLPPAFTATVLESPERNLV